MTPRRPTMRQLRDERSRKRRADMEIEIASGRLTVRQMSPSERAASDVRRVAHAKARAAAPPSR